tara:strand:+ start:211 stop:1362 length:1152 start_codon:yes stop_codon:yes gene_type:complete
MVQKLKFSPPSYTNKEKEAVIECISNSWTGSGPKLSEFENNFREYKEISSAAGFSSCTSAIFLALKSLGIKEGDEVITTAMTFCSTVNCIIHCGAKPILCDIDPITKNICPDEILKKITHKTKAIIPVHYAGFPCEMDTIMNISKEKELYVIEDCAHAIESKYKNQHCGTFGEIGCFSFYATKNIAIGEGGMAISENPRLISKMSTLGLHGLSRDAWRRFEHSQKSSYDVIEIGYKMNLTDIHSAIGIVQLSRIDEMYQRRKEIWKYYNEELKDTDISLPANCIDEGNVHAMHLYAVGLPSYLDRNEVVWKSSKEENIIFGVHYNSIPSFTAYKNYFDFEDPSKDFENAWEWGKKTISLSISAGVSDTDCERIIKCIKSFLKK